MAAETAETAGIPTELFEGERMLILDKRAVRLLEEIYLTLRRIRLALEEERAR